MSRRYFRFDCAYSVQELALASLFPVDRQGLPPGQTANVTFDRLYLKVGGWQGALVLTVSRHAGVRNDGLWSIQVCLFKLFLICFAFIVYPLASETHA